MDEYKEKCSDWSVYEAKFLALIADRKVEEKVDRALIDGGCLLCSEPTPEHCHRRLVAEYFQKAWEDVEIEHIL